MTQCEAMFDGWGGVRPRFHEGPHLAATTTAVPYPRNSLCAIWGDAFGLSYDPVSQVYRLTETRGTTPLPGGILQ